MGGMGCFVFFFFVPLVCAVSPVCVVGGGIAGASCAFFLSQQENPLPVVIVERNNRLGGRLFSTNLDGVRVDVGGDAWMSANENMMHLMESLPIEVWNDSYGGNGKTAVFDGEKLFSASKFEPILELEVAAMLEDLKLHLKSNYKHTGPFRSIAEYVGWGGLSGFMSESSRAASNRFLFPSAFFRDFQWEPLARTIYDQNLDNLTLFAGAVSLLSAERSFTCKQGNDWIVKELAKQSNATVLLNTNVGSIVNSSLFDVHGNLIEKCSAIVIAAPIEMTGLSFPTVAPRLYRHWWVTLVAAESFSRSYFGVTSEVPDSLLTLANSSADFVTCAVIAKGTTRKVYKCFSNLDISSHVEDLFSNVSESFVHLFDLTFPLMTPNPHYQPVLLANNLIYVSGMESVAVAMEGSVISGKNAAKVIEQMNLRTV